MVGSNSVNGLQYRHDRIWLASRLIGALAAELRATSRTDGNWLDHLFQGETFVLVGPQRGYKGGRAAVEALCQCSAIDNGTLSTNTSPKPIVYVGADGEGVRAMIQSTSGTCCGPVTLLSERSILAGDASLPSILHFARGMLTLAMHEGYGLLVAETCAVGGTVITADIPTARWLVRTGTCGLH